jgi:DNA-binding CsgD family transcriptional regulator
VTATRVDGVFGRDRELAAVTAFIESILDGPRALLLAGEAGIGKTTLWRTGIELALERGYRALACLPTASETAFSFAGLSDLLSPVVDEVLPRLPAPQRAALGAALALVESEAENTDERVVGLALLSALRRLAARDPVLVAVDDVQWLDPASAAALRFAARRLQDESVKLLLSGRVERGAAPRQVERDLADRLLRIRVGPLSSGDLHRVIVGRFSRSLPRIALLRVHEASAGNPFYALEITRFLLERRSPPSPGDPLPVPPTIEELLHARIKRLPAATREVLEAAALLSEPTIGVLEGSSPEPEPLDRAVIDGVIEVIDDRIRFTHPLFAAAVVSMIGPRRRRRLHARLAAFELDPEERARHRALAGDGPDAATAESLEAAAQHAVLRGAHSSAAVLAELAARRTPGSDREARWRRLIEAGLRHAASGDFSRARAVLEPLLEEIPAGPARARVLLNLADIHWDDTPEMISLAERALAEVGEDDVSRARIHGILGAWLPMVDAATRLSHLRAALEAAERAGDEELTVLALVDLVSEEVAAGQMAPGRLERALAIAGAAGGQMLPRVPHFENPGQGLASALIRLDRFDEARVLLERARRDGLAQGAYPAVVFTCVALTDLMCRVGEWPSAALYASELAELCDQLGLELRSPFASYARARVEAYFGNVDEARAAAGRGIELSAKVGMTGYLALHQGVLGFLELSLDDPAAAVDFLQPAVRRLDEDGWRDPCGDLRPNAIEALVASGELDEAAELLSDLADWSQVVNAPAAQAACSRCRGLLRAARGDRDGAFAAFAEALRAFERLPTPFERGRTLLALGGLQRRAKQKRAARESLAAALATFEGLGARLWAEKARTELAQLGGRRAQDAALTPTESQIASLVAQGRTNQQVADMLFISPKTVEWNLSKIYKKLHVRTRAELAAKRVRQIRR